MSSPQSPQGRHRSPRRRLVPVVALATAAVVAGGAVAVAATTGALGGASTSDCPAEPLRVVATAEIAPVVRQVASADAGECDPVEVETLASRDVVAGLTDGSLAPPDVWIPDSSLWLTRVGDDALTGLRSAGPVATSPLVLAVRRGAAADAPGLVRAALVGDAGTLVTSPDRLSPERVGAVLALAGLAGDSAAARGALAGLLRGARPSTHPVGDLLDRVAAGADLVVPTSEQRLWAHPGLDAVQVVYPGAVTYDFPFAVRTDLDGDPADPTTPAGQAASLSAALSAAPGQQALQDNGLRPVDGSANPVLTEVLGSARSAAEAVAPQPLSRASLDLAETTLEAVNRRARVLAVVDVSGSMAWGLAGRNAPGPSRLRIALDAAGGGLRLYPDGTEAGLWLFPSGAAGSPQATAVREVAPVRPLDATARAGLGRLLGSVRPVVGGATPLYDATLAAVRAHRRNWERDAVNAVIVLSDGTDTASRTPLPRLLTALRAATGSPRPVPVVTVAFGPDSDRTALAAIAEASGGASYTADSGDDVRRIFLDALGQRACRPDCS